MGGKKLWIIFLLAVVVLISAACTNKSTEKTVTEEKQTQKNVASAGEWSDTFQKSCLTCHAVDENGKVARISDMRKTPEGWEQTILRMKSTWGLDITNEDAAAIVAELSTKNGLAPEETDKIMYWLTDTGSIIENPPENELMAESCIQCHAGARPLAQYRTEDEWKKIKDFHIGMNPSIVYIMRSMDWVDNTEKIAEYLAKTNPMETEAWKKWKESGKKYDITGEWKIIGYSPSTGLYSGDATVAAKDNHFYEKRSLMREGKITNYEGNVNLYTGYSLRSSLGNENEKLRGVFNVNEDGKSIAGQWSQVNDMGIYGKETYYKKGETQLLAVWPKSISKGSEQTLTVFGTDLPPGLKKDNFTTNGLQITEVVKQENDELQLKVKVSDNIENNVVEISLAGQQGTVSLNIFEKVDYIKVTPEYGLARLNYDGRKQSVQFEAIAYANGKDGKANTDDDVEIGPVNAKWNLQEYKLMGIEDEDVKYVGSLNETTGLFIPSDGGPNMKREWNTNNTGNVTVVATYIDPKTSKKAVGETFLFVTAPDFVYVK
ncbi:quinohemoprotein amine dehydrogenase subunit alpha [Schinkia azotoformans]|uniref:quinohemoprotein amine dehydrogenase subunit alpha n=1 Tax=Schinkia azotoformans TaxID=1454 RepID=UPI002DB8378B|nr:quinohemoprotein amine dehydrogenase subunit alpha [Schinkia azotoformans]MEC1778067.1 quinohemoprotein amine dehydrogenase subunit alpha [Schinkia azotoformans]MED4328127.1 quinohemoprotein amine dehydrogenase subunit alpha [Schinkia azotoformans]